ncbi:MAG TPA: M56 family metallopeptidase [Pirellulales bacterium]|nr:M56 family metallopeptidase [Pirellulales bacterium]
MSWLFTIGLANALLASALAVVPWALGRWLRRPALAHLLWMVVLCKLLAPPLAPLSLGDWFAQPTGWLADAGAALSPARSNATDAYPSADAETAKRAGSAELAPLESRPDAAQLDSSTAGDRAPAISGSIGGAAPRPSPFSSAALIRFIAFVWIAGSAATVVRMMWRAWQFKAFVRLAARPDERLEQRVAQLAQRAGLAAAPKVLAIEHVVSPMLWGLGRGSTLLFPAPLARRLDDASCDALLLHELAHYARGDGWVRLLELAVQTLYWWHPLVWLARREIEAVEEECCDAWALQHQSGGRRLYAEALLATVDFLYEPAPAPLPPAACGLGEAPLLRRRLTQIMCGELGDRSSRACKAFALSAAAAVLPFSPAFVGSEMNQAEARSVVAKGPDSLDASLARSSPADVRKASTRQDGASETAAGRSAADANLAIRRSPRVPALLWAAAASDNGRYKLEARTGRKTTLVHVASGWRLDLSAHRIVCASFSPDSNTLATGHEDSVVRIWDCETGALLKSLKGSTAAITSLAFAPDGRRLAAGAEDGSVLVWDPAAGDEVTRLAMQEAPVNCVRWSPQGDRLALALGRWSQGDTAALVVWSPGERLISPPQPLAQPVGALDWLPNGESLVLADWDGRARVWSVAAETTVGWLTLEKDLVSAAAWSPNCPLISRPQAEQLTTGARL